MAAATEIFGWMVRNPEHPVAKALSRPGQELQERVATAEPSPEQVEVADAALRPASRSIGGAFGANGVAGALEVVMQGRTVTISPELRLYARTADALVVGTILDDVGGMLLIWLPLVLMRLMVYFLWRVVKLTPRVNTQRPASRSSSSVTWNDVAGLSEVKVELQEVVDFLRDPKRFEQLGARVPKGILFYGPPGTGKTLLAKAVAHESGASFFSQSASAFVEMFAGLGAARIRKLFAEARKHAPAIVFIDELDAVGAARTGHGFNREQDQTLNQLLVELDGFSSDDRVVVMGASNRLQDLDPALLRPGRFDRQVLVPAPDLVGREEILGVHTVGKPLAAGVDLQAIARQTAGLTGADLANIANEAAIAAGRRHAQEIGDEDFDSAMERVVAGLQQRRVVSEKEKRILAYHEAGHALMSHLMGDALPVHKVTIVSRGQALGYTLNLPAEDRYLHTKEELTDMLKVYLAGRAAEQVVFGASRTGPRTISNARPTSPARWCSTTACRRSCPHGPCAPTTTRCRKRRSACVTASRLG